MLFGIWELSECKKEVILRVLRGSLSLGKGFIDGSRRRFWRGLPRKGQKRVVNGVLRRPMLDKHLPGLAACRIDRPLAIHELPPPPSFDWMLIHNRRIQHDRMLLHNRRIVYGGC